jgi:hypothetical protein
MRLLRMPAVSDTLGITAGLSVAQQAIREALHV